MGTTALQQLSLELDTSNSTAIHSTGLTRKVLLLLSLVEMGFAFFANLNRDKEGGRKKKWGGIGSQEGDISGGGG